MMGDGCVRYVGLLGQADIRRRASIRSQARNRQERSSSHRHQLPQGAAAWGMGVMNGTASYHNHHLSCSKSLRGIRVGRAGRAEGWSMDY